MNVSPTSCIRKLRQPGPFCFLLALLTAAAAVAGLCAGAVPITLQDCWQVFTGRQEGTLACRILLLTRLPRVAAGLLAGAALSTAGALIQSVLSNPLASPNIIGVNAGAGFSVALSCALLPPAAWLPPLAAFLGAALGVLLVLSVSQKAGASKMSLVLTGIAFSNLFSAGIDTIVTISPDALNAYSDFRIGGLAGVTSARLIPAAVLIGAGLLLSFTFSYQLDILSLGAETAQSVGVPVKRARLIILLTAAALAGAAVSFAGLLGFVGLIVPQMIRRLMPQGGAVFLACSAMGGALLLTLCDLLSRVLFSPYDLPVGIVMSFVGGPFFIWLLFRQRGGRTHD